MRAAKKIQAIALGLMLSLPAIAIQPFGATPAEKAMCKATVPALPHMHHYCDCLRFRDRALRAINDKDAFRHYLREAVDGCNYVLERLAPNDSLRPRLHIDKARALSLGGKKLEAESELIRALQLDPKSISAVLELAHLRISAGRRPDALDAVTLGLRHNPETPRLQSLYLELGGQKPFPAPIVKDAPPTASPERSQTETAGVSTREEDSTRKDVEPSVSQGCRFCPPDEIQQRWRESFQTGQ